MLRLPRTSPRPARPGAGALAAISAGALALAAPAVALGQAGTIQVAPATAQAGAKVTVTGTAPGCPDPRLLLISRAFPGPMELAGVPAVWARLDARDRFAAAVTLPAGVRPGSYPITGRCGGGNIGGSATLRVVARPQVRQTIASAVSNGFRVQVDAIRTGAGAAPPAQVRISAFERRGGAWARLGTPLPVRPAPGATEFFWKVVTAPGALRDFTLTTAAPQRVSLRVLISPSIGFSPVNRYHVAGRRLVRG